MTTEQRVRVGFGKVNLKTQSAHIVAQRLRAPFVRESASTTGKNRANWEEYPVSAIPDVNGRMYQCDVTHPNGTILYITAQWTKNRAKYMDGGLYLRLRDDAAMLNIEAKLPHGPDSRLGDRFAVFRGRADILSVDEAKLYQINTPHRVIDNFFDPEDVAECFALTEIMPERSAPPVAELVSTPQGLQTREVQAAPVRRLIMRK